MKIVYFIYALLRFFTNNADAQEHWDQSFTDVYKPNIIHSQAQVEIKIVKDADAECKKYGDPGFVMKHCTVLWDNPRRCLFIMDIDTISMGDLGHEARHCFEGDWHARNPDDPRIRRR